MLRSTPTAPFFDVREWMEFLGRSTRKELTGADQLEVLDHLGDIRKSADASGELRRVRRRWVEAQGSRAVHDDHPMWPDTVNAPDWLVDLDVALAGAGFDSGWTVSIAGVEPIGIVRQRGPLRIQLTVLDDEPLIQLAVWPLEAWLPIGVVAESLERQSPSEVDGVIDIGEEFCADAFAHPISRWSQRRRELAAQTSDVPKGPRPGQKYFRPQIPTPDLSFKPEDLVQVFEGMRLAATCRGGPGVQVRSSGRKPAPMSYNGSSYYISQPVRELVDSLVPDVYYFEFSVDGDPYFIPTLNGCSGGDKIDYSRSRMIQSLGRPEDGGLVLDPRKLMRSIGPGTLVNQASSWLLDEASAEQFNKLGIASTPVWRD